MAYLEMPVRSDLPCYEFQIQLENVTYGFEFSWSERAQKWVMDIKDASGNQLLTGVCMVGGVLFLDRYKSEALPPGDLFINDTTGANGDPTKANFGSEVKLVYRESGTVDP